MKRIFSFLTIMVLLFSLSACDPGRGDMISFYYCRNPEDYQFFEKDSVIRGESREIIGHQNDLNYMIGLYLAGPLDEGLVSPLPRSAKLLSVSREEDALTLTLSDLSDSVTDMEFSLACACLTMTCMDCTGCGEVTVISGERSMTMTAESIRLTDTASASEATEGGTP